MQGIVADLLLDPDRGKLVALLVHSPASSALLALQIADILSWGKRIHIQDAERLWLPREIIRLAPFLEGKRRIIGQRIQTQSGVLLGKCVDIQFDAEHFTLEWIFPRRFLRKGIPLPASDILEITEQAIIVKDQTPKEEKIPAAAEEVPETKLEPVTTPVMNYPHAASRIF